MRDDLAQRLLAAVMNWDPSALAAQVSDLQALAGKYDEYQRFSPGMRFIESLALWLQQFKDTEEKQVAFEFVKSRLVFISSSEMKHLVTIAYSDFIRNTLIRKVASTEQIPEWRVHHIVNGQEFAILRRQSMFLALSDGSHIDTFRRANPEISHEQVLRTHEIERERASEMLSKLHQDLTSTLGHRPRPDQNHFRMAFLLDDFSGSGLTYLRRESEGFAGKVEVFHNTVCNDTCQLVDTSDLVVCLVLYVATEKAKEHLLRTGQNLFGDIPFDVQVIHLLDDSLKVSETRDKRFTELLKEYYDDSIEDAHYKKGRHRRPYLGFDECALPLVLAHNTPNNSLPILWFERQRKFRGLFPRVARFKV